MDDRCRETLERFWNFAGLDPIDPDAKTAPQLEYDDVALDFASSEDQEYLIIRSDCGRLQDYGADQTQQMERILQLGFALLKDHDVLLHLEGDKVQISAFYPYASGTMPTLADLVSDVTASVQTIARLAQKSSRISQSSQNKIVPNQEPAFIFHP